MNRLIAAALGVVIGGCANFNQLEADALDAGRRSVMSGGSAGGMSGGSTGAGTAGGAGGGTAGGAGGGTAGGAGGGTAGGAGAGSAGGASGGSAAGGCGAFPGFGATEAWAGLRTVISPVPLLAVAASSSNGQLATAQRFDAGVIVETINAGPFYAPGTLADLDARFGSVVLTTSDGVWLLNTRGFWYPVTGTPSGSGVGLSTPIFRATAGEQLASYWRTSPTTVTLYSTSALPDDGGTPPGFSMSTTGLPNPLAFRVRPDQNGDSGVIAGSFNVDGGPCLAGSQAVFARIDSQTSAVEGGNVVACDMLLASSEDQTALLVWRGYDQSNQLRLSFWQPRGANGLPSQPDSWLASNNGFLPIEAIATDGLRHAAIVYQPANSAMAFQDAGVCTASDGYLLVVVGGSRAPRFVNLGAGAGPPFGLAFGSSGTAGVFVMANCSTTGGMASLCSSPGAVVGFISQP